MLKKICLCVACLFLFFAMNSCSIIDEEMSFPQKYKTFLSGEEPAYYEDGSCVYCDNELKKPDGTIEYTLADMTGDGVPELHVIGRVSYLIITENSDTLQIWYHGTAYEKLLNNHAILYTRYGTGVYHKYIEFSDNGDYEETDFSVLSMNEDETLYFFGEDEVSQAEYEKLVLPFLAMKEDKIKWTVLQG